MTQLSFYFFLNFSSLKIIIITIIIFEYSKKKENLLIKILSKIGIVLNQTVTLQF